MLTHWESHADQQGVRFDTCAVIYGIFLFPVNAIVLLSRTELEGYYTKFKVNLLLVSLLE